MGFRDLFRSEQVKRARKAAEQVYAQLTAGRKLEIPASISTDDDVALMVMELRKRYPDTVVTMMQAKTIVLTLRKSAERVGDGAWGVLDGAGYFPDPRIGIEGLIQAHQAFAQDKADVDLKAHVEQRKAAEFESRRIEVVSR